MTDQPRNETYQITVGVPPLNHVAMVQGVYRQHAQVLANCDCQPSRPRKGGIMAAFDLKPGSAPKPKPSNPGKGQAPTDPSERVSAPGAPTDPSTRVSGIGR